MFQLFNSGSEAEAKQEIINSFFAEVEIHGGPTMDLKTLEGFVYKAPKEVKNNTHYCYLAGLLFSRFMHEVVGDFDPESEIGPYMPFNDLEAFIMASGEPDSPENDNEPRQKKFLRGFYDGRLIHEQLGDLGGIKNVDH